LSKPVIYQQHPNESEGNSTHAGLLLGIKVNVLKNSAAYIRQGIFTAWLSQAAIH